MSEYDAQPEAVEAGLPADERSHARLFGSLLSEGHAFWMHGKTLLEEKK